MPSLDPRFTATDRPDLIEVVQHLGADWVAVYRLGMDRARIKSITIAPMTQNSTADPDSDPAEASELTSQMLRELVPGAAIAFAAASLNKWAGPASVPLPDNRKWLAPFLGGERLAHTFGPEWLVMIEKLEGRPLQIDRRDARRWRLLTTAARYVAARKAGDRKPVATVAEDLGLPQSQIRDRLYAARTEGFLEGTGRGRAGGDLTPQGQALLEEIADLPRGEH